MKVISLFGSANKGKTGTLRYLIDDLLKNGATLIDPQVLSVEGDVRCCIRTTQNGLIVITTSGDDLANQIENKRYVKRFQNVDVWITAARNYGGSVDAIWDPSIFPVNEVMWVKKIVYNPTFKLYNANWNTYAQVEGKQIIENDQEICNLYDAKRILRLI